MTPVEDPDLSARRHADALAPWPTEVEPWDYSPIITFGTIAPIVGLVALGAGLIGLYVWSVIHAFGL